MANEWRSIRHRISTVFTRGTLGRPFPGYHYPILEHHPIVILDREVQTLVKARNELTLKVEWQFSLPQAREKLSRHHEQIKTKN